MKIAENLKAAWTLIDSPEKWTQEAYARDRDGNECLLSTATCFCSIGAVRVASHDADEYMGSVDMLEEALILLGSNTSHVPTFNDNHSYEDVKAMWQKAIALAEERGV